VIEKGLFRSFLYDYNGNEITVEFYCPKEILIESFSLFRRIPSKETYQAISDGTVWKIEYDAFQDLLQRVEGFREWGRTWATNQLFVLKQRSIDILTISTLVYFYSEEINVELGRVEAAGGKIIRPKQDVGDNGFIALIENIRLLIKKFYFCVEQNC